MATTLTLCMHGSSCVLHAQRVCGVRAHAEGGGWGEEGLCSRGGHMSARVHGTGGGGASPTHHRAGPGRLSASLARQRTQNPAKVSAQLTSESARLRSDSDRASGLALRRVRHAPLISKTAT